jgi:hypothetical protein
MRDMKGEGQVSDYERKLMKNAGKSTKRGEGQVSNFERTNEKSGKRTIAEESVANMASEKERKYDEMRNPDRNLKQGAPMPIRQNNGGEVIMRMKRDKRSGRKMER